MQPAFLRVGSRIGLEDGTNTTVDRIEKERIIIHIGGENAEFDHYVGYDKDGLKLFQYRADTVNVHYF